MSASHRLAKNIALACVLLPLPWLMAGCANQPVAQVETAAEVSGPSAESPPSLTPVAELPLPPLELPLPTSAEESRYSFHAVSIPIEDALRLFARDSNLNLVLDQGLTGELTVDFENVSLDSAMDAILDAHDYGWERKGDLIRVYRQITRTYEVDYLRLQRQSNAQSHSGNFGLTTAGGSGGGGGDSNTFQVEQSNNVDFWTELETQLATLLGEDGRVTANRTAGLVTVTGTRRRVEQVEQYLNQVHQGSLRQVEIEVKIVQVELNDRSRLGIDWSAPDLANLGKYELGTVLGLTGASVVPAADAAITSGFILSRGGDPRAVLTALQTQGDLNIVSQPRVRALNNQTAQIRVATESPYYVQTQSEIPAVTGVSAGTPAQFEQRAATLGLVVQVTPQISAAGWITMDIAPVLTRSDARIGFPTEGADETVGPPIIDVRQTTVVARVRSGDTIVIGGLIEDETTEKINKVPFFADLPVVGQLFRNTETVTGKKELVIFITPRAEMVSSRDQQLDW